ncbi:ABC transporter permease [Corynebacterium falsenii]|uniref:Transport permease protein n=1 Tax=Corynebacterium falsenii TaxID=108486 RepID=A0A418Q4P4_9CORY|nr:ABC transporter permease [Corynebacterium falsenii]RIX33328.1 ABC transporter permease [Corynebacterium falsenii]
MTPATQQPFHLATVRRIVFQLKGDPRTIGLILAVPALLLTLLYFVFLNAPTRPGQPSAFTRIGPIMLAVLPMLLMFIVTSVVMLRERTSGTLERILTTPLSRWNLVASYGLVFGVLALVQASILATLILGPMSVSIAGPWPVLLAVAVLDALFGVAFGLLASAFARTEFQAVQFMPLFIGPQIFLCGLFVPIEHMPRVLEVIAQWLPMTWAVDVVYDLMGSASLDSSSWWHLAALAAAVIVALFVASRSMQRQTR